MKATITDLTDVDVVLTASIGGTQVTVVAEGGLDVDGLDTLMEMLEVVRSAAVVDEGETGWVADLVGDVRNIRALKPKPSGILDRHMQQTLRQVRELWARGETKTFVKSASVGPTDGDGGLRPVTEAKSDICVGEIFQGSDGEVREVLNLIESEAGDGPTVHRVRYKILACCQPYRVGERRLTGLEEFVGWMGGPSTGSGCSEEGTGDDVVGDGVDAAPVIKLGCSYCLQPVTGIEPDENGYAVHPECEASEQQGIADREADRRAADESGTDAPEVPDIPLERGEVYRVRGQGEIVRIESVCGPAGKFTFTVLKEVFPHRRKGKTFTGFALTRGYLERVTDCLAMEQTPEPEAQDAGDTASMGQDEAAEAGRPAQNARTEGEASRAESPVVGLSPGSIRKGARYTDGDRVREVMEISGRIKALQTVEWQGVYPDGSRRMGKVYTWTRGEFAAWAQKVFVPPGKPALRQAQDARDEKPEGAAPVVSKKAEKPDTPAERVKKPAKSEQVPKPAAPLREPDGEPAVPESPPAPYPPAETVLSVDQVREECPYLTRDGETVTVIQRRCGCVGMEVKVEDADGEMIWMSLSRFVTDHRLVPGCFYPVST